MNEVLIAIDRILENKDSVIVLTANLVNDFYKKSLLSINNTEYARRK